MKIRMSTRPEPALTRKPDGLPRPDARRNLIFRILEEKN